MVGSDEKIFEKWRFKDWLKAIKFKAFWKKIPWLFPDFHEILQKFPDFSRFSLTFSKNSPFSRFSRFSLTAGNPGRISCFSVSVSLQKEIHVSLDSKSQDAPGCGDLAKPCHSIPYALQICEDGDTILLDSRFKYILNESMRIQFVLQIKSYRPDENQATQFATVEFDGHFDCLIEIYDNASFTGLSFRHQNSKLKIVFNIHNKGQCFYRQAIPVLSLTLQRTRKKSLQITLYSR